MLFRTMRPMTVKELRERTGLSQRQLAKAAGMDAGTVRRIESGQTRDSRYGTISALADVLGVTTALLANVMQQQKAA